MKIIGEISIEDIGADWGSHEAMGRHGWARAPMREEALSLLRRTRGGLLGAVQIAEPMGAYVIELEAADIDRLTALEHPLRPYALGIEQYPIGNTSGDHVRRLRDSLQDVSGPIVGVARDPAESIAIIDGTHRVSAWTLHAMRGRTYPLRVNVIVTRQMSWWEDRRPPARAAPRSFADGRSLRAVALHRLARAVDVDDLRGNGRHEVEARRSRRPSDPGSGAHR
jgi:hypothetical protein